jgi:hypothetical protein
MFRDGGWREIPIAGGETRQLPLKMLRSRTEMAEIRIWHAS